MKILLATVQTVGIFFSLLNAVVLASPPAAKQTAEAESNRKVALQQFLAEREAAIADSIALEARLRAQPSATAAEIQEQRRLHLRQRGEILARKAKALSESNPRPAETMIETVEIPENASPAMEEFLTKRAELHNARLMSEAAAGSPANGRRAGSSVPDEQLLARMKVQTALAVALAQESAARAAPNRQAPPEIPANASPKLRAFLMQRQLVLQEAETAASASSDQAPNLQSRREQEKLRMQGLGRAAQELSEER
jgi:hypothetical protein